QSPNTANAIFSYKTSRTIDELRGFESLTRHFAIADREQANWTRRAAAAAEAAAAAVASPPQRRRPRPAIEERAAGDRSHRCRRLLTLPTLDRSGGSCAAIVFDLRPAAEKAVCRLKHDRLVLSGRQGLGAWVERLGAGGISWHLASGDRQSARRKTWWLLLVLAWHRGASERVWPAIPGSCRRLPCAPCCRSGEIFVDKLRPGAATVFRLSGVAFRLQAWRPCTPAMPTPGRRGRLALAGPIDESLDDSSEPLVAVLSLEGGGGVAPSPKCPR
uniref:MOSC_N domain-containing protein n=1 Tax=Macrostomum lignano TaxID=282301 RepID=A0A1I8F4C3_9PLAT